MSLDFLLHLARLRDEKNFPLGEPLTELGLCNAIILVLRQSGMSADLMRGEARAYRASEPGDIDAYAEVFSFNCIKLHDIEQELEFCGHAPMIRRKRHGCRMSFQNLYPYRVFDSLA